MTLNPNSSAYWREVIETSERERLLYKGLLELAEERITTAHAALELLEGDE